MVWRRQTDAKDWIDVRSVADAVRMMRATEVSEPAAAFEMSYAIGAVMYEWVLGTYGMEGFTALLRQLATAQSFDEALRKSIGLSQSEFYAQSAPYVVEVFESAR